MAQEVGIIIVKDGKVVGVELFDHPDTFEALKEEIYQKYAIDITTRAEAEENPLAAVAALEKELEKGEVSREDRFNIGGENIYIDTDNYRGTLFRREGKPIYLSIVKKSRSIEVR